MQTKIKKAAKNSVHALMVVSVVILYAAFIRSWAIAESGKTGRSRSQLRNGMAPRAETNRIVRVLESRMDGQRLQEKVNDKLSTLSPEQIRLLDSLAIRIIESDHTAASDIVFLLLTALIISS